MRCALAIAVIASFLRGAPAHSESADKPRAIDYSRAKETAFGRPADPRKPARTIAIEMSDTMRFSPAEITVKRGEAIRFVATNAGKLPHEMVLGRMKDLKEHAEHMKHHPGMEHDEPNMLHVAPGKTG